MSVLRVDNSLVTEHCKDTDNLRKLLSKASDCSKKEKLSRWLDDLNKLDDVRLSEIERVERMLKSGLYHEHESYKKAADSLLDDLQV